VKRIVSLLLVSLAAASQLHAAPGNTPFEPTASLGLGLLAALVGFRFFRRLKKAGFKKRLF
jgi:hypothetical protein